MEKITSLQNGYIKSLAELSKNKNKKENNMFLVDGDDFILEASKANCLDKLLVLEYDDNYKSIPQIEVTKSIIDKLSINKSSSGKIGVCHYKNWDKNNLGNKLIYLDGVQDPGNVGTIIRTSLAFNYDAVIMSEDTASIYNDKLISSTKGAIFLIPTFNSISLKELKELGYQIIVTTLQKAKVYDEIKVKDKFVIVMGSEGQGVKESSYLLSDERVKIPMDNIDSLNVGVAAGILLNEYRK